MHNTPVKSVRRKDFDIAERSVKHANYNKGQGIRANSGKSEGGNLELTSCTHTQEEKELVPVSSHATLSDERSKYKHDRGRV